MTQGGLRKSLKAKTIPKTPVEGIAAQKADDDEEEDWEDLDAKATSGIRLCLAKIVLANVSGEKTAKGLWEKLESLYQIKSLSNRLYLKERLHTLKMNEGTNVGDHLGSLNGIVLELVSITVKVEDEDKMLQLIWSLPSSFKHLQPTLMYGNETLSFEEVTSTLLSEERRLKGSESFGENSAMVVSGKKSFNRFRKGTCWSCGKSGHYRSDCKAGKDNEASSARGSESDTKKLATVTSNDGDEALLVVVVDGYRQDRGWFLLIVLCFRMRFSPSVFPTIGIRAKLEASRVARWEDLSGLRKALKAKPIPKTLFEGIAAQKVDDDEEEDWEDLDSRAANGIRLCLAKDILTNVCGEKTAKGHWEKLKSLYQTKSLSNRLYLNERLHTLKMNEGTSVGDHLGSFNGIVSKLESIGVKVEDEYKAVQLIWLLPSSFKHLQPTLMYGKETFNFEEVTSMLLSEERRLKGSESFGKNSTMVVIIDRIAKRGKVMEQVRQRGSESDTNKLATVTSNDGEEALLVVVIDGSCHDR
ncbi:hypothetical protein GIB67_031967 [Kingdonia uniflora]|uniref:CCHC-type domain-containing protein n=1 Tax=Kingdonia uniflora TaxID=39325 RepID=A0A7J7NTT1_9MAGN|nr:hypothetical protein GIB67_031967 [Kingdonia uniflora]